MTSTLKRRLQQLEEDCRRRTVQGLSFVAGLLSLPSKVRDTVPASLRRPFPPCNLPFLTVERWGIPPRLSKYAVPMLAEDISTVG
jgi:hypothetical protein